MASVATRPATAADLARIAAIHYAALELYHSFYAAFFTVHPCNTLPVSIERAFHSEDTHFLVAEDEYTSEIAGFVRWKVVDPQAQAEALPAQHPATLPPPQSLFQTKEHLAEIWKRFGIKDDEMEACYEAAASGKRHYYVQHLMIDPSHQKRGIGGKLLSTVLKRAQGDKLPTFLMSSAESFGLYSKLGFEDLGKWTVDNGYWTREVARRERELGITAEEEGLVERYEGVGEVENVMVKRV